jgi:hypothetical protein
LVQFLVRAYKKKYLLGDTNPLNILPYFGGLVTWVEDIFSLLERKKGSQARDVF